MNKFLYSFILLILLSQEPSYAQFKVNLDSLRQVCDSYQKEDTLKLKMIYQLVQGLSNTDMEKAINYADLAITIADKINDPLYRALLKYEKATILMTIGDLDESKLLLNQVLPTFEKMDRSFDLGNVYKNLGSIALEKQELDIAKKYYEKGITYYVKADARKELNKIKIFIGHIVLQKGGTKESIKIFDEVIEYYEKNKVKAGLPNALAAKAQAHFLLGEVSTSAECLYKAMSINEELGNFYGQLINYQNLSSMYNNSDQHQKGLEYALKGLELNNKVGNKSVGASLKNNVCDCYINLSEIENAKNCYQELISYMKDHNLDHEMKEIVANLNRLYTDDDKSVKAYQSYKDILEINKSNQAYSELPRILFQLGIRIPKMSDNSLTSVGILPQNKYDESNNYLKQGIQMASEHNDVYMRVLLYNAISLNYEKQKKYPEAYEAYKQYVILKDSLSGDEVQKKITKSEIQYEYDKKELALKYEKQLTEKQLANQLLLTAQQKQTLTLKEQALLLSNQEKDLAHLAFLQEQAEKQEKAQQLTLAQEREKTKEQDLALKNIQLTAQQKQNLYLGAFIIALLCGLSILIYFYQTMRRQKNIISQQNQLNEHTISILSHDIKEPLLGVKLLLKKLNVNDPYLAQASLSLENQISTVNGVLGNLLKMKKLAMAEGQKYVRSSVQEVIHTVTSQLQQSLNEKNIRIQNTISADLTLPIATEKLQVVVHNILSNAIKYSHPDQTIKIYNEAKGFCIQDFGVGLSDEQTIRLMTDVKNSKPGTSQEKGNGMGLFLVGMLLQGEQVRVIFESPEIGGTIVKIVV